MRKILLSVSLLLMVVGCFPKFPEKAIRDDAGDATDGPNGKASLDARADVKSVDPRVDAPAPTSSSDTGAAGVGDVGSPSSTDAPAAEADARPPVTGTVANGKSCSAASACASGYCVAGICCDSACGSACVACTMAATGKADGVCAPATAGTDPGEKCEQSDKKTCGLNGSCDGKGACSKWGTEAECGAESCSNSEYHAASRCDGAGQCKAGAVTSCDKLPCEGTRCKGACTANSDCPTSFYCEKGACLAKKATGSPCAEAGECSTGACVDKFCCQNDCKGACKSCAMASTGKANGICDYAISGADPHNDCEAAGTTCGQDGWCDGKGACRVPGKETSCGQSSCLAGQITAAKRCDGGGACGVAPVSESCKGFLCADSLTCKTQCSTTADCDAGAYFCSQGRCVPKKSNGEVCAAKDECSSKFCAGRCCPSNCNCFDKSVTNLLNNPGLDQNLDGWTALSRGAEISWSRTDSSCPYSGSLQITNLQNSGGGSAFQCVGLPTGTSTFNAGGEVRATVKTSVISGGCEVAFLASMNECLNVKEPWLEIDFTRRIRVFSVPSGEVSPSSYNSEIKAPVGAAVALFHCFYDEDGGPTAVVNFDRLYLNSGSTYY